ncbi:hypothetical protein WOLCODRAFT_144932 [Wolfiporia cocos MD-104 SS10]|uniref:SnoaL-like domain-containing protein n=1 Tax=Wolfiporia cocos (strain MD-104) TaxID=742152 RepID=A0A2H3JQA4_WOLCO|nr:hypothetical protein WOLCODRAFT_144932 [Wolfiporia cocos MD-104 SS10]
MAPTRDQLLTTARALCAAFASAAPVPTLLSHFSATYQISAREHGLPLLAPFLGRTFAGRSGPNSVQAYFELLRQHLTFRNMEFVGWTVDAEASRVCVRGHATFEWTEGEGKGQVWNEVFVYMLDFDEGARVTDYQVWADSGAAYLARRGTLLQQRKEFEASENGAKADDPAPPYVE